jgi:type II secretory pathway pseudopilin PulG
MMRRDCPLPIAHCQLPVELKSIGNRKLEIGNSPRAGFTFIEVLFAVILLGIGFIMIAAVFPVAIQQTSAVSDETQGTALARDAIKKIQAAADSMVTGTASTATLFPVPTGASPTNPLIAPFPNSPAGKNLMAALGSDIYASSDGRYGWVGFYRRDLITNPFAQIYIIALENPNFPNYVPGPSGTGIYAAPATGAIPVHIPPPIPPNIMGASAPPAPIPAQFFYSIAGDGNTTVVLSFSNSTTPAQTPNGVTGAYVLIAGGGGAPANMVGRFFRLGNAAPLPTAITASGSTIYQTFVLQPGSDLTTADGFTASASAPAFSANIWMIGAAPLFNSSTGDYTGPFSGPNQDIGVATGFIRVNTTNN